jgi:CRISPR system Cascade subunit CasE
VILVQTLTEPDWQALEPGYAEAFPPRLFEPALRAGQVLTFRLRANPSKRLRATKKRVALRTRSEKVDWLSRRLKSGGFLLLETKEGPLVDIVQDTLLKAYRKKQEESGPQEGHQVRIQAVLFQGHLEVVNPALARTTLERGIGPGKALGLGLLSLCP